MGQQHRISAEPSPAGVIVGNCVRPIGSFFALGMIDIPATADSIWNIWCRDGAAAITAWTARAALTRLIQATAPARVWLPAYSCPEVASVAGAALRFFPVDEDLSPKVGFLRRHLRAGDLIIATDYFGWPPSGEFQRFAAETPDIIWVEDRAHCLFTDDPPWATWILYSPRKVVGVADGGILVSRDGADGKIAVEQNVDASLALPELMRFEDTAEMNNEAWYKVFKAREARFSAEPRPMSRMTAALLRRIPLAPLVEARRRNYRFLAERLGAFAAWPRRASAAAPFGLAIKVEDGAALGAALAEERLFCTRHWPVLAADPGEFAWEHEMARRLVTLPCDHRYDERALSRLVEAVHRLGSATRARAAHPIVTALRGGE
jgi:hypothetical protein